MSATVHQLHEPAPDPVPRATCTKCGTEATCDCNAPYVPAGERAAAAVAASPDKSNRAIAAEIGVSDKTVAAARAATAEHSAVQPAKRIGKDGKARRMPAPTTDWPQVIDGDGYASPEDYAKTVVRGWNRIQTANAAGQCVFSPEGMRIALQRETVEEMIRNRQKGDTDGGRRDAIRRVALTLSHTLADVGVREVLRNRKDPIMQTAAYEKATKMLADLQTLLDLARVAP